MKDSQNSDQQLEEYAAHLSDMLDQISDISFKGLKSNDNVEIYNSLYTINQIVHESKTKKDIYFSHLKSSDD